MKRAFLAALLIVITLIIFLVLIVGFIYIQFTQEPDIPENSILKIHLAGSIIDYADYTKAKDITIKELWYHLNRAKIDGRIHGVIVKISYLSTGLAKIEEIGGMLKEFKKSGKKVYTYIEEGGLKEFLLASYGNKVYLYKNGMLLLNGLSAQAIFIKNTLKKIGLKGDFINIGEYKTAPEMFTEDDITPSHRESLQTLIDDLYESTLNTIALNRNIDKEELKTIVNSTPVEYEKILKAKLIDDLVFEDELLSKFDNKYQLIDFKTYSQTSSPDPFKGNAEIALIFANGEIYSGESEGTSILNNTILGSETLIRHIRKAKKNPRIKAVVLRIDSPGGSSVASDFIHRELALLQKEKPLVISMSDLAASGGYMISLAGVKIYAHPQTLTGSIGVYGGKLVAKGFYDMIGMKKVVLKTSEFADIFDENREFSPAERMRMMEIMKSVYLTFKKYVQESRKMTDDEVEKVARGRVWSGKRAFDLKLVDQFGGLDDSINEARKLAKIPSAQSCEIVIYPPKKSFLEMISSLLNAQASIKQTSIEQIAGQIMNKINRFQQSIPSSIIPYQLIFR